MESEVVIKARQLKQASYQTALLTADQRQKILLAIAEELNNNREELKRNNEKDVMAAKAQNMIPSFIERLTLTDKYINDMIRGLQDVAAMEDRLGNIENMKKHENGLLIGQMYAPLGVIAIIYESRPNVTVDAVGLCIKAGNTILLRGGSEAINSNIFLVEIMKKAAITQGFPEHGIEIIENTDRILVNELVTLRSFIDVVIPRGNAPFIEHIMSIAKIPVIETGAGNCHTYIDKNADLNMALELVYNGKVQRPSVCNATKKVLVHQDIADVILPRIKTKLEPAGVIFLPDQRTFTYFPQSQISTEAEWAEEFLDMRLGIKIVNSLENAIAHINQYSSHHTETIVTSDYSTAMKFISAIDSASVIWNASTRFTDGSQFGLGAEIGISTQKLHWRGPMSVYQLMSKKFVTFGSGQIRK